MSTRPSLEPPSSRAERVPHISPNSIPFPCLQVWAKRKEGKKREGSLGKETGSENSTGEDIIAEKKAAQTTTRTV